VERSGFQMVPTALSLERWWRGWGSQSTDQPRNKWHAWRPAFTLLSPAGRHWCHGWSNHCNSEYWNIINDHQLINNPPCGYTIRQGPMKFHQKLSGYQVVTYRILGYACQDCDNFNYKGLWARRSSRRLSLRRPVITRRHSYGTCPGFARPAGDRRSPKRLWRR